MTENPKRSHIHKETGLSMTSCGKNCMNHEFVEKKKPFSSSDFVLVRNLNNNKLQLLYCGEPSKEEKAFLYIEKLLKGKVRKA